MKRLFLFVLLAVVAANTQAKDGYHIRLKLSDRRDSIVYLAYYFGKPLPTIYKIDSVKLDRNGTAVFDHKDKITGGIYMMLPSDRKSYFELLLNDGDDLNISARMDNLPESISISNSPLNEDFLAYQKFLKELAGKQQKLEQEYTKASSRKDSSAVGEKISALGKELIAYRRFYVKQNPGNLLTSIFNALEVPQIPEGKHFLDDGKEDSLFVYRYYKAHYWDGFNFKDDRLIHTPLLEMKLNEYFNKILYQYEDTVIAESDSILEKMRGSENLFKFTLNWLSTNSQTSKIMGMDKVFVHLVQNYYMKGDARWLSNEDLSKYIDRAEKIAPNIVNNPAPELKVIDAEGNEKSLYDFKAKYTLLVFYSPDCGHCMHEIPLLDSVYRAVLKDKGVRVFAFNVDTEELKWREFITKHHLEEWMHVWDPKHKSRYWAYYDVQATPSIYLLDEHKIIKGKKLDHTTIPRMLEILEYKDKMGK